VADPRPWESTIVGQSAHVHAAARLRDDLRYRIRETRDDQSPQWCAISPSAAEGCGLFREFEGAVPLGRLFDQAKGLHEAAIAELRREVRAEATRVLDYCRIRDASELGRLGQARVRRQVVIPNLLNARFSSITLGDTLYTVQGSAEPLCFAPEWEEQREAARPLHVQDRRRRSGVRCATVPDRDPSLEGFLQEALVNALASRLLGQGLKDAGGAAGTIDWELPEYERSGRTLREDWPRMLRALARAARG
jgi:hypothetical protein